MYVAIAGAWQQHMRNEAISTHLICKYTWHLDWHVASCHLL